MHKINYKAKHVLKVPVCVVDHVIAGIGHTSLQTASSFDH